VVRRLVLLLSLLVLGGSGRSFAAPPPLAVSPSGSDLSSCTAASPCRSFDRAYVIAAPGQSVLVADGVYPGQSVGQHQSRAAGARVVFRPAPGAKPKIAFLHVYGSHVEFRNLRFTTWPYWRTWPTASDVTFRDIRAAKFTIFGSSDVRVIGGDYGPTENDSNVIAPADPSDRKVPTNIVLDHVRIHDFRRTDGTSHVDCLHSWGVNGLVVRNSRFSHCQHFDILFTLNSVVGTPTNITIENNFFDCCLSGYYSVYLGGVGTRFSNVLIRNNSANRAIGIADTAQTIANVRILSNIAPKLDGCGRRGVVTEYNVWTAGSACGPHDRSAASGFLHPAKLDFRLKPCAAAVDRGDPRSFPPFDIDGHRRPQRAAPDAGAYEVSTACRRR
jgi:hypothetical protein